MLDIQSLSAGYQGEAVLHDFSLRVAPGEIAAVIGPNGCGKSTLLGCVAGLLTSRSGQVLMNGDDVSGLDPRTRARRIAFLPQSFEGGHDLTVAEMTLLGRTPYLPPYGTPGRDDRAAVDAALQAVSAGVLRHRRMGELSGGERQRAILARAVAQQPQLLLLDEPISNLDIRYQYETLSLIHRLARQERLMILLVLHQINLAAAVADSMVLLSAEGRVCAQGTPQQVMTAEHLQAVYGVPLRVAPHPISGRPQAQSNWVFEE
ncbi:MAG TPA: ABC transporter ATP-binding protein [Abditibacteriaceae bacterium]|nr:ABC transporter ATP-binding protein [Abditibacteriaceae bacterium]